MKVKVVIASAALAAALAWSAFGAFGAAPRPVNHVVHIKNMTFNPHVVEIAPGDSITWVNEDIVMHAAKSADPKHPWQSANLLMHQSWTGTFERSGPYVCPYHPTMTGEIVVHAPGGNP